MLSALLVSAWEDVGLSIFTIIYSYSYKILVSLFNISNVDIHLTILMSTYGQESNITISLLLCKIAIHKISTGSKFQW